MSDEIQDAAPQGADTQAVDTGVADSGTESSVQVDNVEDAAQNTASEYQIPEAYRESKWAEGIKSEEDVWKKLANSQELIGKKTIQPIDYENASPEDIDAYHASIVPQDIEAYKFGEEADPEFSKAIVPALQKAGIHPAQLAVLEPLINKAASDLVGEQHAKDRSEDGYFELAKEAFGDNYKDAVAEIELAYRDNLNDDMKQFLDNATNKDRVIFDSMAKSIIDAKNAEIEKIRKEYGAEETGAQAEGGDIASGKVDIDDQINEKREELDKLNSQVGAQNWQEINKVKADIRKLYDIKAKRQGK